MMRGLIDALRRYFARFTPGQQWTAGLAFVITAIVISFGLPPPTESRPQVARPAAIADRAAAPVAPRSIGPLGPSSDAFLSGPLATVLLPALAAPAITNETVEPPARPEIVAVVRSGDGLPGRDDAAIAAAYIGAVPFDVKVMTLSSDPTLCAQIVAAGQVVVSSEGLPATLRNCLLAAGATLIAYDALGDVRPVTRSSGQVLSTRRGTVSSLSDLARWGLATGRLGKRVALVSSESLRGDVTPAVAALSALGLQFTKVYFVPEGSAGTGRIDVPRAIDDFTNANIDTVLFAARASDQRWWTDIETVKRVKFAHVVSDVADSIVVEDYTPGFDAFAHTSLLFPWWERERGATAEQKACRDQWQAAAPAAPAPSSIEMARAYMWCLHLMYIVAPALKAVEGGTPFATAVRTQIVNSPLTSTLEPAGDGAYGPGADVVLKWNDTCKCWAATGSPTRRPAAS